MMRKVQYGNHGNESVIENGFAEKIKFVFSAKT